jgi:ATP-dependent helicase Lhr and Lhr-like helicase
MSKALSSRLPQKFQDWFRSRGWEPRRHQLQLLAKAKAGRSVLLVAPTGAGKTLAGFLPSLVELTERDRKGKEKRGLHTLYISPLKALATDVARNLENPVQEMGLPIRIETRTGDTPSHKRARQIERPPDILLTTPEQLALLLAHHEAEELFKDLRRVVLDELHSLVTSKRGDLLSLGLARLFALAPQATAVGLSATVREPDDLRRYLAPQRAGLLPPPCGEGSRVGVGMSKLAASTKSAKAATAPDFHDLSPGRTTPAPHPSPQGGGEAPLAILDPAQHSHPDPPHKGEGERVGAAELIDDAQDSVGAEPSLADLVVVRGGAQPNIRMLELEERLPLAGHTASLSMPAIYDLIRGHRTTLVFVNTRLQAEYTFQELWKLNEDGLAIALHHGSLDVSQRRRVEEAMAAGKLKAVVCTATLDLGIDWGDVDGRALRGLSRPRQPLRDPGMPRGPGRGA